MRAHLDARLGLCLLCEGLTTLGICPGGRQRTGQNEPRHGQQDNDGEHNEENGHDGNRREKLATSTRASMVCTASHDSG